MGLLSDLNKKRKKLVKSVVGSDIYELASDVGKSLEDPSSYAWGLIPGMVGDFKDIQKAGEKAERAQKKMLLKQQREALLEQAKLQNEIAMRQRIAKYGGRRSLLMGGETGFSMGLLQ